MTTLIEGLTVKGEIVKPLGNKSFKIIGFSYVLKKDDKDKDIRKLMLNIKLMDNEMIYDYYPNMSSQGVLACWFGNDLELWLEKLATFKVIEQKVMGNLRQVLYIDEDTVGE